LLLLSGLPIEDLMIPLGGMVPERPRGGRTLPNE